MPIQCYNWSDVVTALTAPAAGAYIRLNNIGAAFSDMPTISGIRDITIEVVGEIDLGEFAPFIFHGHAAGAKLRLFGVGGNAVVKRAHPTTNYCVYLTDNSIGPLQFFIENIELDGQDIGTTLALGLLNLHLAGAADVVVRAESVTCHNGANDGCATHPAAAATGYAIIEAYDCDMDDNAEEGFSAHGDSSAIRTYIVAKGCRTSGNGEAPFVGGTGSEMYAYDCEFDHPASATNDCCGLNTEAIQHYERCTLTLRGTTRVGNVAASSVNGRLTFKDSTIRCVGNVGAFTVASATSPLELLHTTIIHTGDPRSNSGAWCINAGAGANVVMRRSTINYRGCVSAGLSASNHLMTFTGKGDLVGNIILPPADSAVAGSAQYSVRYPAAAAGSQFIKNTIFGASNAMRGLNLSGAVVCAANIFDRLTFAVVASAANYDDVVGTGDNVFSRSVTANFSGGAALDASDTAATQVYKDEGNLDLRLVAASSGLASWVGDAYGIEPYVLVPTVVGDGSVVEEFDASASVNTTHDAGAYLPTGQTRSYRANPIGSKFGAWTGGIASAVALQSIVFGYADVVATATFLEVTGMVPFRTVIASSDVEQPLIDNTSAIAVFVGMQAPSGNAAIVAYGGAGVSQNSVIGGTLAASGSKDISAGGKAINLYDLKIIGTANDVVHGWYIPYTA